MWDQLNTESEKMKRLTWLFLLGLLASHAIAILLVGARLQNLIFILAILSAFFIVAQVGRIKIWLTTVSAGVAFGLLPVAQTAGSAEKFSLLAWKAIMHTALGTSLALLLMAEIPFRGDASLALALDTVLMVLALVSMVYIEMETKWYPKIVRALATLIIAIILMEVTLGIAYPELSKPDRWWKLLELIKNHKIALVAIAGISLLVWKGAKASAIPKWILVPVMIVGLALVGFWTYSNLNSVEKWLWQTKGAMENATEVNFTIDSLKERSWPNLLPSGRYRVSISGGMYFYRCPGWKGSASGYPSGARPDGGKLIGQTGGIVVWSSSAPDNPQGNNGVFIAGPNNTIFARFETECPGQETVIQTSDASIQLSPMK